MSLSTQDLQNIGSLVDQKLEPLKQDLANVGSLIDQKLEEKLKPVIDSQNKLTAKVNELDKKVVDLQKGQRKMFRELRLVTKVFDEDVSYHSRCIKDLYRKTGYPELPQTPSLI